MTQCTGGERDARHQGNGLWEVRATRPDSADLEPALIMTTRAWTPILSVRAQRVEGASESSWFIKLEAAIAMALAASDATSLPQTVYKTEGTCGWSHTNGFARVLHGAQVDSTWLPNNYFR